MSNVRRQKMQVILVLVVFVLATAGLLGLGVFRVRTSNAASTATALSFSVGASLTLLALLAALRQAMPATRVFLDTLAFFVLPALVYVGVLAWFLRKYPPPNPPHLVISGLVLLGPLWFLALLVGLVVACLFGDCI
jgi:hypothetical protein